MYFQAMPCDFVCHPNMQIHKYANRSHKKHRFHDMPISQLFKVTLAADSSALTSRRVSKLSRGSCCRPKNYPPSFMTNSPLPPTPCVGTLNDGYIRRVPLPRAPQIQSTDHVTCNVTVIHDAVDTCYLGQVPRIPTWNDLSRLIASVARTTILPFLPVWLI